jgi:hypothetical protein
MIPRYVFREKLKRYEAVKACVLTFVHHTHPAPTEFLDDAVVRDGLADNRETILLFRPIKHALKFRSRRLLAKHRHSPFIATMELQFAHFIENYVRDSHVIPVHFVGVIFALVGAPHLSWSGPALPPSITDLPVNNMQCLARPASHGLRALTFIFGCSVAFEQPSMSTVIRRIRTGNSPSASVWPDSNAIR